MINLEFLLSAAFGHLNQPRSSLTTKEDIKKIYKNFVAEKGEKIKWKEFEGKMQCTNSAIRKCIKFFKKMGVNETYSFQYESIKTVNKSRMNDDGIKYKTKSLNDLDAFLSGHRETMSKVVKSNEMGR